MKAINSLEVCQKPRVVATTADRVVRLNMGWTMRSIERILRFLDVVDLIHSGSGA
jgi:hypothetical protein